MKPTKEMAATKLRHVRKSASRRGYACTLTIKNVEKLLSETRCIYTGETFSLEGDSNMSFDRVDNTRGYEPGNVIPVITHANHLKSNFDIAELKTLADTSSSRFNGFITSVAQQIAKKDQKIQNRRKQIEELERGLSRDLEEMEKLQAEHERAEAHVSSSVRDSQIYASIVRVLETHNNLGDKYMTLWQRVQRKLAVLLPKKVKLTTASQNSTGSEVD